MEDYVFDISPDVTINIDYVDASKKETRRTITAHKIHINISGEIYMTSTCHEKMMKKSFRMDRIKAIFNENGEIMEKDDFLRMVGFDRDLVARKMERLQKEATATDKIKTMSDAELDAFLS